MSPRAYKMPEWWKGTPKWWPQHWGPPKPWNVGNWRYPHRIGTPGNYQYLDDPDKPRFIPQREAERRNRRAKQLQVSPTEYRRMCSEEIEREHSQPLTSDDVMRMLGVKRTRFAQLRESAEPEPFPEPTGTRPLRWRRSDVQAWKVRHEAFRAERKAALIRPLTEYLDTQRQKSKLTLSMDEIIRILGGKRRRGRGHFPPEDASRRRKWWREDLFNPFTSEQVGWQVTDVDLQRREVTFVRRTQLREE